MITYKSIKKYMMTPVLIASLAFGPFTGCLDKNDSKKKKENSTVVEQTAVGNNNVVVSSGKGTSISMRSTNGSSIITVNGKTYRSDGNSSVIVSNGNVVLNGFQYGPNTKKLEKEVKKSYGNVKKLTSRNGTGNINLKLSENNKVSIDGYVNSEPKYNSGTLNIGLFRGDLALPESNLELDINLGTGDIKGDVVNQGRIETGIGDINLDLHAPLEVIVNSGMGSVSIKGMMSEGNGRYVPPNKKSRGRLYIESGIGDVDISYKVRRCK